MATIAKLMVELGLEGGAFDRGISKARASLDSMGESARKWGGLLTAGVTTPIVASGLALVNWASDLEQTLGATEQLWGDNADSIIEWSKQADTSMGMTQDQALTSMNRFNAMFKQMSSDRGVIRGMSEDFVQLSADLSAMWGGSSIEASDMLTSALRGNYEGLDRYNINLTEALVNTEAMAIAVANGRDEITEADKVQARYNLIMEQSTDAQGQFARETDTTAGRLATASARAKNLATSFGRLLLPAANKVLDMFSRMLGFLERLTPTQQKWIIGIAAAAAALGPLLLVIGMLLPGLSALIGLIGFMVSPIGLVIAAVALLAYLFRGELMSGLSAVMDKVGDFIELWQRFRADGLDPVQAALVALQTMFPALAAVIAPLRGYFDSLLDAFNAIKEGNFHEAFNKILEAFRNLGSAIKAAWQAINWSAILAALGDLAGALGSWLWAQASSVDWGGVIGRAASSAGDITATIVSKLGNLGAALFVWLWTAATSIPWGDVLAAAVTVGDIVGTIVGKLGDLGTGLKNWYDDAIEAPNWAGMGETIGAKVGDLSRTLVPKAGELIQGFLAAVTNPGLWAGVGMALLTMMLALPAAIGYVGMTMAPKALEFLRGFVTGLDINWYLVSIWMLTMPAKLLNAAGDLSMTLLTKGIELLQGLLDGLNQHWPTIQSWLSLVASMALAAIGDLTVTLLSKGIELISGFLSGLDQRWPAVVIWLALTGIRAFSAVGDLASTLLSRGTDLIQGFLIGAVDKWSMAVLPYLKERGSQAFSHIGNLGQTLLSKGRDLITGFMVGATAKWTEVSSWLSGLGGKAVSAVGSLGSVLYNAGASLLQGLMDGINSKIGALQSLLGTITSMIPDFKGPAERDAKLLEPSGRLIMGGLSRGLDDGWQDVTRQLSGYVPTISGAGDGSFGAANGADQRPIQIITLEPGKWKEFLENAMAGGTLAREFGPEIAMYGGKPS